MTGLLILALTTLGGWLGWELGARFGIFVAFLTSLVGTAAGLYYARRIARWLGGR